MIFQPNHIFGPQISGVFPRQDPMQLHVLIPSVYVFLGLLGEGQKVRPETESCQEWSSADKSMFSLKMAENSVDRSWWSVTPSREYFQQSPVQS